MTYAHVQSRKEAERAWKTLGFSEKPVSIAALNKAFRIKARELHPDKHIGDEKEATQYFKRVTIAYDFLIQRPWTWSCSAVPEEKKCEPEVTPEEYLMQLFLKEKKWRKMVDLFRTFDTCWVDRTAQNLEDNIGDVIGTGDATVLEFLWQNTKSGKVLEALLNSFLDLGDLDTARKMLNDAMSGGRFDWVSAMTNKIIKERPGMGNFAISVLENNVEVILEDWHFDSILILLSHSTNMSVQKILFDYLVRSNHPGILGCLIEEKGKKKDWEWVAATAVDLTEEHSELIDCFVSVLESHLDDVLRDGNAEVLVFLGRHTSSERTMRLIINALTKNESGRLNELLNILAEQKKCLPIEEPRPDLSQITELKKDHSIPVMKQNSVGTSSSNDNEDGWSRLRKRCQSAFATSADIFDNMNRTFERSVVWLFA